MDERKRTDPLTRVELRRFDQESFLSLKIGDVVVARVDHNEAFEWFIDPMCSETMCFLVIEDPNSIGAQPFIGVSVITDKGPLIYGSTFRTGGFTTITRY